MSWKSWLQDISKKNELSNFPFLLDETNVVTHKDFWQLFKNRVSQKIIPNRTITLEIKYNCESILELFTLLYFENSIVLKNPKNTAQPNHTINSSPLVYFSSSGLSDSPTYWPHSFDSLTSSLKKYCELLEITELNRTWTAFPAYTVSGFRALIVSLRQGGTLITKGFPSGVDLYQIFNICNQLNITTLSFPPVILEGLLLMFENNPKPDLLTLSKIYCGGDYVHHSHAERFKKTIGLPVGVLFGATETAGPISYCPAQFFLDSSIGQLIDGEIVSPKRGEVALLKTRGGYISPEFKNNEFLFNDYVYRDENDCLFFKGRDTDWVEVDNRKLFLVDIENFALGHSQVATAQAHVSADSALFRKTELTLTLKNKQQNTDPLVIWIQSQFPFLKITIAEKPTVNFLGKMKRFSTNHK